MIESTNFPSVLLFRLQIYNIDIQTITRTPLISTRGYFFRRNFPQTCIYHVDIATYTESALFKDDLASVVRMQFNLNESRVTIHLTPGTVIGRHSNKHLHLI